MKRNIFILFIFLLTVACNDNTKGLIAGQWSGIALVEEGDTLAIDPSIIQFSFDPEKSIYTYRSTLNYQEAGKYYIQSKYLVTTDTTTDKAEEKSVEILNLQNDTLSLRMMDSNKERVLTFVKE